MTSITMGFITELCGTRANFRHNGIDYDYLEVH